MNTFKFIFFAKQSCSFVHYTHVLANKIVMPSTNVIKRVKHCKKAHIVLRNFMIRSYSLRHFYRCTFIEIDADVEFVGSYFKYLKHTSDLNIQKYDSTVMKNIGLLDKLSNVVVTDLTLTDMISSRLSNAKKIKIICCDGCTTAFNKTMPNTNVLSLSYVFDIDDAFFFPFRKVQNLIIEYCGEYITEAIFDAFEELRYLKLTEMATIDHIPNDVVSKLRKMHIDSSYKLSLDWDCKALMVEELTIKQCQYDVLRQLVHNVCMITKLVIPCSDLLCSDYKLFEKMNYLRELDASECFWFNDDVSNYIKHIKILHIQECCNITNAFMKPLTNLVYLDVSRCDQLTDDFGMHIINVKRLVISFCELTDNFGQYLTNIEYLKMHGCKQITDKFSEHLKNIKMLKMAYCHNMLTDKFFSNLKTLVTLSVIVSSQMGITDAFLAPLANLERLEIGSYDNMPITRNFIFNSPKLKQLDYMYYVTVGSTVSTPNFHARLKHIHIDDSDFAWTTHE